MDVRIILRVDTTTGEVEAFEVHDEGSALVEADHNRQHDAIAMEIGNVLQRRPQIEELFGGPEGPTPEPPEPSEPEPEPTPRYQGRADTR